MQAACRIKSIGFIAVLTLGVLLFAAGFVPARAAAAGTVELYTPYLELSAPPGESISYSVDVINRGSSTASVDLSFDTKGNNWTYELTAGGRAVNRLAVKSGESQTMNLQLEVPLEIDKGAYSFQLVAGGSEPLPLTVHVTEKGTFRTELTTDQANMSGHAESSFSFSAKLRNRTSEKQNYSLQSAAQPGWNVTFNSGGKDVTSVEVEPNAEQSITINIKPPANITAGTYSIPVTASNNSTSAETKLEVVITGTYDMKLSTPNDLLSTDVTAGSERKIDLVVANTGSAQLKNVSLSASSPSGWEVSFEPSTVEAIEPGAEARVQATIKADKKALAGDYVVQMMASSPEKKADAQFRVAVKSSALWGWVGILIIAAVAAGIAHLFRKYGRR